MSQNKNAQVRNPDALENAVSIPTPDVTRVFVSGLPPKFTSEQLAAHFGSAFDVTDAHVLADRRIGFVGFKDAASASKAKAHFNKTYVRMSKIAVDLAKPVELSQTSGSSAPTSRRGERVYEPISSNKRKRPQEDDGEQIRVQDQGQATGSDDKTTLNTDGENDTKSQVAATDNDWLRGRTNRVLDLVDPDDVQMHIDEEVDNVPKTEITGPKPITESAQAENGDEAVPPSRQVSNARLFLRNLAFSITQADLQQRFGQFGKIQEIHLVQDRKTSSSRGTAFIQFAENHQAEAALAETDGTTLQGRLLHVLPASDKRDKGLTEFEISQMPLKKQKAVRRKLDAAKQTFSWNSLYMNPDAVLSSIAARLGVTKADILDPTSADAAIKQAHAETQLIKETKQYLDSCGVNIEAFKNHARDDHCLLLKNFPYGTTESELRALAEPFGSITKFLLPPAGTMALVRFDERFSASEALKGLAYKNIKGSVLYLEKAPQGILDQKSETSQPVVVEAQRTSGPSSTVFVKNLNFSTSTARLQEIASSLPGFVSARVKTRTDNARPGQVLSMGFGFLEFSAKDHAESAVKALTGHRLDGHELTVQLSSKGTDAGEATRREDLQRKKDSNQTKIIIKNLPFQTSKKDIRSLFSQYGELKMVRVPRKFDNTARGFAFAEFVTPKEASNAMEALTNTHLLGRRLVLDFAEGDNVDPEEEIKAIERKVEQQSKRVHYNNLKGSGRKKFNLEGARDDELDA